MGESSVHPLIGNHAQNVEGRVVSARVLGGSVECGFLKEGFVGNRGVYFLKRLKHHAAGAHGEVTDFGSALSTGRNTHRFTGRIQKCPRVFFVERLEEGRVCVFNGIARVRLAVAETVEDAKENFFHGVTMPKLWRVGNSLLF